jgi:hypothetical protein
MSRRVVILMLIPFMIPFVFTGQKEVAAPQSDPFQLALVLKGAREYCRRLESAALDFVCVEDVSEKVDLSHDKSGTQTFTVPRNLEINPVSSRPGDMILLHGRPSAASVENNYLFDYQFVREAGKLKEKKTMLLKNGKKPKRRDSLPETLALKYKDILLAPVELLDEKYHEFMTFKLIPEDSAEQENCWVLEATPRKGTLIPRLGGRIRLNRDDMSVVRIDWDPTSFGHFEAILSRARQYDAKPDVVSYTVYGFEKNGIRFPSLDLTEESYIFDGDATFVRARTRVEYRDYKFFVVETASQVKKQPVD